jgi:release factor glutamine methyltransferase
LSTIARAIQGATERLSDNGFSTPRLDAEVLLRHVLRLNRTQLFVHLREALPEEDQAAFDVFIERRIAGEPVAYITGEREFMGLPFAVGPGVLIPRPETEVLVEWALAWLKDRRSASIVDVGTGSGAIALSVAANRERRDRIIAADLSPDALRYAAANRSHLGFDDSVHLVLGDLLTWCAGPIDLVLGNLPYLRPDQVSGNPDLQAEPVSALKSGSDGLDSIRRLLGEAPRVLSTPGAIALEIDPSQAESVSELMRAAFPAARIDVLRDLAGWDRVVVGTLAPRG